MKEVILFVDGAAQPNPGIGGYGVILLHGIHRKELRGSIDHATNNRMEIIAAIEGLKAINQPCKVTVISDSQYLINGASGNWNVSTNLDLWADLDKEAQKHTIDWQWVKGHNGTRENERADQLANMAITEYRMKP